MLRAVVGAPSSFAVSVNVTPVLYLGVPLVPNGVMRYFLTLLVRSVRAVLLIPCLLIGLACATPFPIENLKEGMAAETARESFGEPEDITRCTGSGAPDELGGVESVWTYPHEEQDWFFTLNPLSPVGFLMSRATGDPYPFTISKAVVLHFEAAKLVRWEVTEPTAVPQRESSDLSVIGASVRLPRSGWWGHPSAEYSHFARLGDGATPREYMRSNFEEDGNVFLFNARPGRYILVSAGHVAEIRAWDPNTQSHPGARIGSVPPRPPGDPESPEYPTISASSQTFNYRLPKALSEKTVVSVGRGQWAFMGDIVLDKRHGAVVKGSLDQGEASLARFLKTSGDLAGEEWACALMNPVTAGPPPTMLEPSPVAAATEPEEDSGEEATGEPE